MIKKRELIRRNDELEGEVEALKGELEQVTTERDNAEYEMAHFQPLSVCLTCGSPVDDQRRDGLAS